VYKRQAPIVALRPDPESIAFSVLVVYEIVIGYPFTK
jgi:hypothetical protein